MHRRFSTPVVDESEADFLYVELDTRAVARCFGQCAPLPRGNVELDRDVLRSTVVDWLIATVKSFARRRSYPSLILALALIRHDYEKNILNKAAMEVMKDDVIVMGIERATWDSEDRIKHFRQVPYPSLLHADPESSLGEWQLSRKRETL